jgi:hypothetical protein
MDRDEFFPEIFKGAAEKEFLTACGDWIWVPSNEKG